VIAERPKLGGAEFAFVADPALRGVLHEAFASAYVAGFRAVMLVNAALAALSALAALGLRRTGAYSADRLN
jgi:hypothetical protein